MIHIRTSPLIRAVVAVILLCAGTTIWVGFEGTWTLIGLLGNVVGGWMIGTLAAEAALRPSRY